MWFNDFYYQYIPKESIENFSDCYSNEKLSDTCRCITLYENLWDYNNPEKRQRQWKFKEAINFVENVNKLKSNKELTNSDPHFEILNGQFEHGGVRLFKFYFDKEGKDTTKSRASIVIIEEYDENKNLVWKSQDALKTE